MTTNSEDPAAEPKPREVRLDRLLGRRVIAGNNHSIGRLEECRAAMRGSSWVITEYVIGVAGLFERLGVGLKLLFGRRSGGYVARWDQVDLDDPEHPRVTCGPGNCASCESIGPPDKVPSLAGASSPPDRCARGYRRRGWEARVQFQQRPDLADCVQCRLVRTGRR